MIHLQCFHHSKKEVTTSVSDWTSNATGTEVASLKLRVNLVFALIRVMLNTKMSTKTLMFTMLMSSLHQNVFLILKMETLTAM